MKYYEFRYQSKSHKIIAMLMDIAVAFLSPILTVGFSVGICIANDLDKYWPTELYFILFGISVVVGIIFVIKYCTALKGVILYDDHLSIDRYAITDFHYKPNIKIYYKDIKYIYNSSELIGLHTMKARKGLISGGDKSYYIEIGLNGGKELYFPVENQDEFFHEVLKKVNEYREKHNIEKL